MAKKVDPPKAEETKEDTPGKSKKGWGKIILLVVGLLVLAGGGGVAYIILADDSPEGEKTKHVESHYLALEPFLINLADKDVRRYLKVKMELEVPNEKAAKELEKSLPRLRDACILLLSNQTYNDISSTEGKVKLKEQIMKRVAELPGGQKVSHIFFTEFVAQ